MFSVNIPKLLIHTAIVTAVLFAFPLGLPAAAPQGHDPEPDTLTHETGFYYTVQKGDTLWDISRKFFDTPMQWPDLWQHNDQLPNPHWIYPGEKLRLYLKDGVMQVEVVGEMPTGTTGITAPIPTERPYYKYPMIDQVGFIRSPAVAPHGVLFKAKDDKKMISQRDQVYIEPTDDHELLPGQKYTLYRTLTPLGRERKDSDTAYQHYLVGIVEITNQQPDLAVATVVRSFRDIQEGDLLMPYHPKSPKIYLSDNAEGLGGRLLLSEEHHELLGNDMVGFIDKGSQDGVKAGQSYVLYYHERVQETNGIPTRTLPAIEFGSIIVLHTEKATATVLITRSDRDIAPGALFKAAAE